MNITKESVWLAIFVWPFYTLVNEVIDNKPNQIKALTEYSASIYINPEFLITIFTLRVE